MTIPPFLRPARGGVALAVKVQPRAKANKIGGVLGQELKVKVTAPPVDSAANEALVLFVAESLGCARSQIELVRGHTSRHKVLQISGISLEVAASRLGPV